MSFRAPKASWIFLTVVGALLTLASLTSAGVAYFADFSIGGVSINDLAAGHPSVMLGLRGARSTAASYSLAFALLYLFVVTGPYRRGERWSWWALLVTALTFGVVALLRMPLVGIAFGAHGTAQAMIQTTAITIGLLLDVGRVQK